MRLGASANRSALCRRLGGLIERHELVPLSRTHDAGAMSSVGRLGTHQVRSTRDVPVLDRGAFNLHAALRAPRSFKYEAVGGWTDDRAARDSPKRHGRNVLPANRA
jgi:hypothetical protein